MPLKGHREADKERDKETETETDEQRSRLPSFCWGGSQQKTKTNVVGLAPFLFGFSTQTRNYPKSCSGVFAFPLISFFWGWGAPPPSKTKKSMLSSHFCDCCVSLHTRRMRIACARSVNWRATLGSQLCGSGRPAASVQKQHLFDEGCSLT